MPDVSPVFLRFSPPAFTAADIVDIIYMPFAAFSSSRRPPIFFHLGAAMPPLLATFTPQALIAAFIRRAITMIYALAATLMLCYATIFLHVDMRHSL